MELSVLESALTRLSTRVTPSHQLGTTTPGSGRFIQLQNHNVHVEDPCIDEISTTLMNIPVVAGIIKQHSIQLRPLAHWLLAQIQLSSSATVIKTLEDFLTNVPITATEVVAVWGLNPVKPIRLHGDIHLVPLSSLAASQPKDELTGIKDTPLTGGTSFPAPRPAAALTREFLFTPLDKNTLSQPVSRHEEMDNVRQVLIVSAESSVCEIASWFQYPMTVPLIGGVNSWSGQAIEHIFHAPVPKQDYDEQAFQLVSERFMALSPADHLRLSVPISRLNQALRETNLTNMALELGIALESLLTNKEPPDAPISYRIRQRGTWLKSHPERRLTFTRLKKLYELRSDAAHGGTLPSAIRFDGSSVETREFLRTGCVLCAELIRILLKRGFVVDWDGALLGW